MSLKNEWTCLVLLMPRFIPNTFVLTFDRHWHSIVIISSYYYYYDVMFMFNFQIKDMYDIIIALNTI